MQELADVYARSLFEVAQEHDSLDEIHEQLDEFADAVSENRDLQVFLFSPYFSAQEKKESLGKLLEGANDNFYRFLELLAERNRMPVIFRIRRAFDDMWAEERRRLEVEITSAIELDDETVKSIGERIEEQTGRDVQLEAQVDPDVLGGIVLRVGNMVLDASVRARLERLRRQVTGAAA
ncbi:MAG TPA: ATP synthase F1 subunit delta [Thermoleophilaceae bacterium]|nr:ATP synthase F1 subunit delta [Thermoleophilaceae bacterium]